MILQSNQNLSLDICRMRSYSYCNSTYKRSCLLSFEIFNLNNQKSIHYLFIQISFQPFYWLIFQLLSLDKSPHL